MLDVLEGRQERLPDEPREARLSRQHAAADAWWQSTPMPVWDLYVVYEGVNPATGQPIIKAFLNPLVGWIWGGFALLVFGTLFAHRSAASRRQRPR